MFVEGDAIAIDNDTFDTRLITNIRIGFVLFGRLVTTLCLLRKNFIQRTVF